MIEHFTAQYKVNVLMGYITLQETLNEFHLSFFDLSLMKMVFQLRQSANLQSRSPDSATNCDFYFLIFMNFDFHEF